MNQHDTIGQDLVNHCVNDVAVCGARPLFFLDYLAVGKLQLDIAESVISGMVKACYENGCSLIGGETAEMPGFYREKEYDLAGTIVGVVDREAILDGKKMRAGDVVIGLPSTGLHTNGYSLARSVLFERHEYDDFIEPLGMTLGESLLKIHRSYLRPIEAISGLSALHGLAHITGGGIEGNTRRIVPPTLELQLDWQSWQRPPIFELIQKLGNVPEEDMRRAFNLGIGLVIVAGKRGASGLMETLRSAGEQPMVIGEIRKH
jgi:phosphoribosylformylglycinamidine cyclo-ligase